MNCLRWLWSRGRIIALQAEQLNQLHDENRSLRADLEALQRVNADLYERLLDAQQLNLDHSFYCVPSWGNSR